MKYKKVASQLRFALTKEKAPVLAIVSCKSLKNLEILSLLQPYAFLVSHATPRIRAVE